MMAIQDARMGIVMQAQMKHKVEKIEGILTGTCPGKKDSGIIMEAMNYSLLAGGKRHRPMLMNETYRLFRGKAR